MGSGSSIIEECELEGDAVEIKDWRLLNGKWRKCNSSNENIVRVTIFQRILTTNSSKRDPEFYENATRGLKVYRHPYIVKYYDSGERDNNIFIITERVEPLSKRLLQLSSIEICSGLHNILQVLVFCHETCKVRHNNFGVESVFVTADGIWKLSGMEFLCKQEDYTEQFLQKNRAYRNESIIPPEEKEGHFAHLAAHGYAGDAYAFGLFAKDLLEIVLKNESLPNAKDFLDSVKKELLIADPTLRPPLKTFLVNKFFQNDFLEIFTFLRQITVKENYEKEGFFRTLAPKLFRLPEKLVAHRLTELLLSRFVFLDASANEFFLPHFLRPCRDVSQRADYIEDQVNPILTVPFYVEYIIPHLTYIFEVLDVHIRTILLTYFEYYVDLFDKETLSNKILPHILLGIRDTNNSLVAMSLRALAALVPLLGSEIVIGGKRNQYFVETKPKEMIFKNLQDGQNDSLNPSNVALSHDIPNQSFVESQDNNHCVIYDVNSEINSPHKEEDISSIARLNHQEDNIVSGNKSTVMEENDDDDDDWPDWEGSNEEVKKGTAISTEATDNNNEEKLTNELSNLRRLRTSTTGLGEEFDIMAIKVVRDESDETNFFDDMQPVISTFQPVYVQRNQDVDVVEIMPDITTKVKYSFEVDESNEVESGWDEDLNWEELR